MQEICKENNMKASLKIACYLLLPMFVGSFATLAQTSETSPGKSFLFKHYTKQNGLINDAIYCMAQDRNGYIWLGSNTGLTRFDGKTFYHKAIPEIYKNSTLVQYLETTPDGKIITTGFMQGVFVQQDDGRFKQYLENGYVELGQNVFNVLKYYDENSALASYTRALFRIRGDSIIRIFDHGYGSNLFYTLDVDKEKRIWFGGRMGLGLLQLTDTAYEPVFLPEFQDKFIYMILFDDDGTLHVATTQGYYRVKWQQPSVWDRDYIIEQPFLPLKDLTVYYMYSDRERNLWIATRTYGVFRTKGDAITLHLTKENGLSSNTVSCMLQDREGYYWFGTNNGINIVKNFDNFAIAINGVRYTNGRGLEKDAYNRIWIPAESASLHFYRQDELMPVNLTGTPFEKTGIDYLKIDGSVMWMSNALGLFKIPVTESLPDIRRVEKVVDFPAHNITNVRSMSTDTNGVWICAQNKIFNYRNGRLLPLVFNHVDSVTIRPSVIVCDRHGYYWYGDYTNGLYRGIISRPDSSRVLFDSLTVYKSSKADSSFVTSWIQDMQIDQAGNLWYSTLYTGAYRLSIDSSGVVSSKLYSTENGLLSNYVQHISCDEKGRTWFMTQKGVNFLPYGGTEDEPIVRFIVNEGVEDTGICPLQMDDRLYLLTYNGIYVSKNQTINEAPDKAPQVFITGLLINGVADSIISPNIDNLILEHNQNNLTIEYAAITFAHVDDVRYQYKLEGADNDWSILSERGFVEFASLRPGKYRFKVRAVMAELEGDTGEETSLSFRILPVFYQTVWFYSLLTFIIMVLLYSFYRYRMFQVIRMERMRTRIASDLHDDIGSTLSSISLISEIAGRKEKETEEAKALRKIGVDSREVLNSMDDIIWSVNPKNDSLFNLTVRLREYSIPLCESKNIRFDMQVNEAVYAMKLGMVKRRNIYLITKESVNNAVKHSGCSQLSVVFALDRKQLEITVTDNGCGFDPSRRGQRNGLTNMERRAGQAGMEYTIKSEINKGTVITLKTEKNIRFLEAT